MIEDGSELASVIEVILLCPGNHSMGLPNTDGLDFDLVAHGFISHTAHQKHRNLCELSICNADLMCVVGGSIASTLRSPP